MKAIYVVDKDAVDDRKYGITFSDESTDDNTFYIQCSSDGWMVAAIVNSFIENFSKDDNNKLYITSVRSNAMDDDGDWTEEDMKFVIITTCSIDKSYPTAECWFTTINEQEAKKAVKLIKQAVGRK